MPEISNADSHCAKEQEKDTSKPSIVVDEAPIEGLPQMNQTLFKRVQSQNFLAMAEEEVESPYDPKTAKPATELVDTSRHSQTIGDTTKSSTHHKESAFAKRGSVRAISTAGIRTSAYKMMSHSTIKSQPYRNNIIN